MQERSGRGFLFQGLALTSFTDEEFEHFSCYQAAQKRLRSAKAAAKVSLPEQVEVDGVQTLVDVGDSAAAVTAAGAAVDVESAAASGAAVAMAKAVAVDGEVVVPVGGVDAAAAGAAVAVPVQMDYTAAALKKRAQMDAKNKKEHLKRAGKSAAPVLPAQAAATPAVSGVDMAVKSVDAAAAELKKRA
jgi:hypothetical protein